jgi:imidazolonepropionase-like amidohydrolase
VINNDAILIESTFLRLFLNRMNRIILFLLAALSGTVLFAQETFPVNGVHDARHIVHAFTNANVFVGNGESLENATVLVQDGRILGISSADSAPAGTVKHDCSGKTIYPSFVDMNCGIEVRKVKKPKGTQPIVPQVNAGNWNPAIHPETIHSFQEPVKKKAEDSWMASGFGIVNLHKRDGIMRGASNVYLLGESHPNLKLIKGEAVDHFSFSKGSSKNDYPSSLIGAIALVRQTFYDAQWYERQGVAIDEKNMSLQRLNDRREATKIFELNNALSYRNVIGIGEEFSMDFIMIGTGSEYKLVEEIPSNTRFVLPINYPKSYDVSDPYSARMVSLNDLKHWELAPFNAAILDSFGIGIALSRDTIKSSKGFIKQLQKTISTEFDHNKALVALTMTPATWLGIDEECGSITAGKLANFFISNTTFDQPSFKIETHWIRGREVFKAKQEFADMIGAYNLVIEKKDFTVKVKKATAKGLEATIKAKSGDDKMSVKLARTNDLLTLNIFSIDTTPQLLYQLTGKVSFQDGVWDGRGTNQAGNWVEWAAIRDRNAPLIAPKPDSIQARLIPEITNAYALSQDSTKQTNTFVITNAVVWTAADTGILERADVYVVDGTIKAIGKDILFPSDVKRINANGRHLTPGLIDEHSHIGIRGGVNEWAQSSSAEVRIGDAVDPWNVNIYRQLAGGVTTAQLLHGSANPIGGQSAIVKLKWGRSVEEMLVKNAPKFIKFALGENVKRSNRRDPGSRFPLTRMGVEQSFLDAFVRAKEYDNNRQDPDFRKDIELEALVEILNDERYITCHSYVQSEILMLMNLADSLGFRVNTFTHILEGYKVSDEMLKHEVNASTFSDWWAYKFEVNDAIPYNAALLTKAGVNTGINSDDAEMGRRLNQEAAKAMKYGGLSEEEAIKLVTINPAKMLHLSDSIGSIEIGKSADLVLWSGNPLSVYAHAEKTFIKGELFFDYSDLGDQLTEMKKERSRLIKEMIEDGEKNKTKPMMKKEKHMHCDTVLENYWEQ